MYIVPTSTGLQFFPRISSILFYFCSLLITLILLVQNSNASQFPRTVVINLPRHDSRRQHMINELSSNNIKFSWIDAVDGSTLGKDEYLAKSTTLARWFMTPGMIGCFLSHHKCWEECVKYGRPLLIFEDDVMLLPNFKKIVEIALKRCYKDDLIKKWDILLLGALGCVHPQRRFGINIVPALVGGLNKWRKRDVVANMKDELKDVLNTTKVHSPDPCIHQPMCPFGMHAYIITPHGASKLLKACPRASYHVDVVALGQQNLNIWAIHPLIAYQTHSDTTIGGSVNWWKDIIPSSCSDTYTGTEIGWALSSPLLRVGGPFFGGKILLTNGLALGIMLFGLIVSSILKSISLLYITILYIAIVTALVRVMGSKWNSF